MRRQTYHNIKVRGVIAKSGTRLYEIQDGHRTGYVDAEHFARNSSDALAGLVSVGMTFLGSKRAKLIEELADVEDFQEEHLFDRIGHNGEHFVYPSGEVFSPANATPGQIIFTPPQGKCHRSGSLGGWLTGVAGPLAGHPICEFFLMVPFAGPLRTYTRRPMNFGWEIAGEGGTGKTVLLQLMCSTCGGSLGGDEGNFGLSFATTGAGIEWEFQNYSDLILCIDEGNALSAGLADKASGRALAELLVNFGLGREKHRYKSHSRTFQFVFATTANQALLDVIGGTKAKTVVDAVADRLMTISLFNREFGIFDSIPKGYDDTGDVFADLVNAASQHHGQAMPNYLQVVVNLAGDDRQAFIERIEHYIAEFRLEARVDRNAGSPRRVVEAFGLVYAAGMLAKHAGSLPTEFDPLNSTLECYRLYRAFVQPELSAADIIVALLDDDEIIDLDRNPHFEMSKHDFDQAKGFRRINKYNEVELLIPTASIRRLMPDWNKVRRDNFDISRMMRREGDHHTVHRKIRANSKSKDRVLCFIPSILQSFPPLDPEAPMPEPTKAMRPRKQGRRKHRRKQK